MEMEEGISEEETSASSFSRFRSPTFSRREIKTLIDLVGKYKHIILNRNTNTTANQAKGIVWLKIAKAFNNQGFKCVRTADCLRTKWDNLKKDARKLSKNVMDVKYNEFNDLHTQIITMMSEAENSVAEIQLDIQDLGDELNEPEEQKETTDILDKKAFWDECEDKKSDDSLDGENDDGRVNRALNFSPQECSLLLKCVREEKKHVLCRINNAKSIKLKNRAWNKITESFNKQSPQKRSTKVLRTKFTNMKRLVKKVSFRNYLTDCNSKHERLINENKSIKSEPEFEYKADLEAGVDESDDDTEMRLSPDNIVHDNSSTNDPLSIVLNSDSGIGSSTHLTPWSQTENKEVVKLKLQLLNYQTETAKLERKRLEDAIQADALDRDSRALETSLRLRAARLNAVAAEMRLPTSHPALRYTAEEARAHQYLNQYQT